MQIYLLRHGIAEDAKPGRPDAERHPSACAMQGLNAVEIVSDYRGDTYRSVYTTRLKGFIYVLHCFQKKSKAGIKTPKRDLELIRKRLAEAELHFRATIEREE